jgi:hypothetical protein
MEKTPLYAIEKKEKNHLELSREQTESVRDITLGIEEVDEIVRELAVDDVVRTLENGHPLNRLIADEDGAVSGYIACEDFLPREAYIKYLGTTKSTGRNLLAEIPAFLKYAEQEGYLALNFHGWNARLNRIMERYGFERLRTDTRNGLSADYYEKRLGVQKSSDEIEQNRSDAFEQKYATKLNAEYQKVMSSFPVETKERDSKQRKTRSEKERDVFASFNTLRSRLEGTLEGFGERQKLILRLKLARHFQNNEAIDENTLYDAIIESPRFLDSDKGLFSRLLEVHEEKTLMKIAEMRKRKAEETGEGFNPYEALYMTESGKYYVARLLNMPHLEEESTYMNHCVGTSDSYVNRLKKGEIEILSFRNVPTIDKEGNRLNSDDTPILTIEYNLKTKTIEQMKKHSDDYLSSDDLYYHDVIDALKQLRTTATDTGELRNFKKISESELGNIAVDDYHLLTEQGETSIDDFDPESGIFVLKTGRMDITPDIPKEKAARILAIVEQIKCAPKEIAYTHDEVNVHTKAYIGPWSVEIFQKIRAYSNIEHLYESFPDKKIFLQAIKTIPALDSPHKAQETLDKENIYTSDWGRGILQKTEFSKESKEYDLVRFSVAQLGFLNGATTEEIYKKAKDLGLELCPAEVGPLLRLQSKIKDWTLIAMEQITDRDGDPRLFYLHSSGDQLRLDGGIAGSVRQWSSDRQFVFRFRKFAA